MLDMLHDAFRSLRRAPGFALLTVGILAIGVGLNAAIFTVVDCVLLRPLGYHDADRILSVQTRFLKENRAIFRLGGGDYVDLAHDVRGLEATAFYSNGDGAVQVAGQSSIAPLAFVSPQFGQVMGVQPIAGGLFGSADVTGTSALVSASFAREHFGSVSAAPGKAVRNEQGVYTIVGVLPDGFSFPAKTSIWFELNAAPDSLSRSSYNQGVIAKRRADVSFAALQSELATFSHRLQRSFAEDKDKSLEVVPLQQRIVGRISPTLHLLMAAVAVVLLIVCANITHLQMVRATRKVQEIAIRSALGASRSRLMSRSLIEATLLSIAGCAFALLLAYPTLRLFVHLAPAGLPRLTEVTLNWHVLLFSFLISFVLMAVTAMLPVWRSWHVDQSLVLRQDSARGLENRSTIRLRGAFLVLQVAFTLVLASAAVLLARQLVAQSREDLGFNLAHLYTLDTNAVETQPALPPLSAGASTEEKQKREQQEHDRYLLRLNHLDQALATLRATPGVAAAEAIDGAPLGFGGSDVGYAIQGKQVFTAGATLPNAEIRPITPDALTMLGVPLLRGRELNATDTPASPNVLLINRALAQRQFPGEDPVGKQIMCGYDAAAGWWTIVGVVGDVKSTPGAPADETFYVPVAQHPERASSLQLLVRTAPGAQLSEEALRQRLASAHPDIAATSTSMAQNLSEVERDLRFKSLLFESFAAVSIVLAMLGMYAATAYSVAQRTFEFGLRMALGASRGQVLASVLRTSLWITTFGALAGVALYLALLRVAQAFVGKLPFDPLGIGLAMAGVVLLSVLAAAVPARRASTVDPMRALRAE